MKRKEDYKTRRVNFRISEDEYQFMMDCLSKTTCNSISEYTRKIILALPITKTCRNQSLDALMEELIRLRKELKRIVGQYTRMADRLPALQRTEASGNWLFAFNIEKEALFNTVDKIHTHIQKIAETCLQ
ncbi:MAG TPA: plasmid mobilization relaxosome protein MobC [Chitinophagaceae bacterium]|nr:plasmid mobilization relaxosome protein MobC [Chitinophagaceae bacterium]